ncbi:hypothetical protein [Clostridium estertheticum]|uniref:hypothetical protein n=1 Tax=Clostridium estertheticum TaxID=238834 RepID=UPI001C0C55C7|nr:hypothetical protein [Clostridium estertheticum]MBU3073862.1 hypothetical protein [Clostridium estertheticum]MBU3163957.1 hypothetical protein [Clostridium estertheticum]
MDIYVEYLKKSIKEKIYYWDEGFQANVDIYEEKQILTFIKNVIMDADEKIFCKRRALQELLWLVFKEKLKERKIIALLLDEWEENQEDSLECLRLQYLSLFYQKEKNDIKDVITERSKANSYEVKAEANYQLGLIALFEANDSFGEEYGKNITIAEKFFGSSVENEDNRIDAEILKLICKYLRFSIALKLIEANQLYKKIMALIWETRIMSFNGCTNPVYIGIGRSISKIQVLIESTPECWLDYRKEFNNLCLQFYQLSNFEYKENSFYGKVVIGTCDNLVEKFLEPVFKYNYKATLAKINVILNKEDVTDEEKKFLDYLKKVINTDDLKSKDVGGNIIKELFPALTEEDLMIFNEKIQESNASGAAYGLLEATKRYSYESLLNSIVVSCIKLQGNYLYRDASEDERNDHMRDLLQAYGFLIKDQTRWGISNAGKSAGEVDILVEEKNKPYAIIEALNLTSLDTKYLNVHIDKIYKYDTTGLKNNFIVSYVKLKNFDTFWDKYKKHIRDHKYPFELCELNDKIAREFDYAEIKVALTKHNRNGKIVGLYHVCIRIPS